MPLCATHVYSGRFSNLSTFTKDWVHCYRGIQNSMQDSGVCHDVDSGVALDLRIDQQSSRVCSVTGQVSSYISETSAISLGQVWESPLLLAMARVLLCWNEQKIF